MKCRFCSNETNMTVRRDKGKILMACCRECYEVKNRGRMILYVSCIFKHLKGENYA